MTDSVEQPDISGRRRSPYVYDRAIEALGRGLRTVRPDLSLTPRGAAPHWRDNLLAGIDPAWFQADLESGDGSELKGKFRAAHSSAALAVNTFARFRIAVADVEIAVLSGFQTLRFEAKCSAGIAGRKPPNLDLLLCGRDVIAGIESKCTEHFKPHSALFSPAYDQQIRDWRRETAWFELMHQLIAAPRRYRLLDAAQLVKHAFGFGHSFGNRNSALVYLYWEPRNAETIPVVRAHRAEVVRFAEDVAGASPAFHAVSYLDLWRTWKERGTPSWLADHVAALEARYWVDIEIPPDRSERLY